MAKVYNHDLVGMLGRLARFKEELIHSVSAGSSEYNQHDEDRMRSYLTAMNAFIDWVVAQPQLDLPESSPKEYEVADAPKNIIVESEIVNDMGRLLDVCYEELLHSQSARKGGGLNQFDLTRVRAVLTKCTDYLDNYVNAATPLDLPESSPAQAMSGPGRKGS